jgi:hypothetical protein
VLRERQRLGMTLAEYQRVDLTVCDHAASA